MKILSFPLAFAAATLLSAALPAKAATAVFDFENLPITTETPFAVTTGDYTATFAGPSNVDPGAFGVSSNFSGPSGFAYRLMSDDFLTVGSAFGASGAALTITFSAPTSGFSVDFALDDPANTRRLSFTTSAGATGSAAGALTSGFRYPEGTLSFAGTAFTSLTFQSSAIDFQLDNLRITPAVPEPSGYALLGAGMGAVAFARRRAARKTAA